MRHLMQLSPTTPAVLGPVPVLSYRTIALYREDVGLLRAGCWLNDAIISFQFELFGERLGGECGFIPPSIVYLMLFEKGGST